MASQVYKNSENLIINGTFDTGLEGWSAKQVTWAGGRARLPPNSNLSQTVRFSAPGTIKLRFDVSNYYSIGAVRLSVGGGYCSINRAGPYDVDFTIDNGGSVDLIFTSQGAYDVDNVEIYFEEAECEPMQLLQNGGFDHSLEGWEYDGEIRIIEGQAHFSERSGLFQQVAVKPGTPIVVKYDCRSSNPCSVSCTILEYGPHWFSVTTEWRTKTYTFVAPEGCTQTRVHLLFRLFHQVSPSAPRFFFHLDNVELWACPAEAGTATKIRQDMWSIE